MNLRFPGGLVLGPNGHNGSSATGSESAGTVDCQNFVNTGPGTLAGRYLRTFWQPICSAGRLAAGRAMPLKIMSEDFTLYRGEGGDAHLVAFRCAHRGTQLSTGWVEGDNIRCFYHGWMYDGSGQCVEQPAEPEPFCQRIKIRSYPIREYLGLIFAYLGESEPPAPPSYPEFEHGETRVYEAGMTPCNFFNRLDQAGDTVHPAFAHRQNGQPVPRLMEAEETEYGADVFAHFPNGSTRVTHFHMPNINEFGGPYALRMHWRIPIDDESFFSLGVERSRDTGGGGARRNTELEDSESTPEQRASIRHHGDAVLRGEMTTDELANVAGAQLVSVQDYIVLVGQGLIAPREHDHLGREDAGIIMLRTLWARELQKFAVGAPLKQWVHPKALTADSGVWVV